MVKTLTYKQLLNLPLDDKKKLGKRLKTQSLTLLFIALGSLIFGLSCQPDNGLWAIPLLVGYVGGSMASATSRRINQLIEASYGTPEEEYF
jgi:hypothetical protein